MKIAAFIRRRGGAWEALTFVAVLTATTGAAASSMAPQITTSTSNQLQSLIDAGRLEDLRWPDFTDYRDNVKRFYEGSGYSLAWFNDEHPIPQAIAAITALEQADQVGLMADDYDGPRWKDRLAKLSGRNQHPPDDDAVRFDLALTV